MVELEGSVHAQPSQAVRDARRDNYLKRLGYAVLRLPDGIVLEAPDEFMRRVEDCVWSLEVIVPPGVARRLARLGLPNVFTGDL